MSEFIDLDENPSYQLWLASNAWGRLFRKALEPLELTHVQFVVLASVKRLGAVRETVSQADVCRFGSIDRNMGSTVIRSLEARGLLVRHPDPEDRRAFSLALTEAGEKLVQDARSHVMPLIEAFFSPLKEDAVVLARMLRALVEGSAEGSPADR